MWLKGNRPLLVGLGRCFAGAVKVNIWAVKQRDQPPGPGALGEGMRAHPLASRQPHPHPVSLPSVPSLSPPVLLALGMERAHPGQL